MVIKEKFDLLRNVPNIHTFSMSELSNLEIEGGTTQIFSILSLVEKRVNHFTKSAISDFIDNPNKQELFKTVYISDYVFPISYNRSTKNILINLAYFNTKDASRIDIRNVYATTVYGLCFYRLVTKKVKITSIYSSPIIAFLTAAFIRLFGKEFGLLGAYVSEISKVRFLISCYVLTAFFGEKKKQDIFKASQAMSGFKYSEVESELNKYDFSNIEELIRSLSDLKAMPGLNRNSFTARVLRSFGINFLPALEDLSRFISVITVSDLTGSTLVSYLKGVNDREYNKILTASKAVFK